jgi:hypothetical protein
MSYALSADRQPVEPAGPSASGASTTTNQSHVFGSIERNMSKNTFASISSCGNVRTRGAAELLTGQDSMRNRARAAAVISESIRNPATFVTPTVFIPALSLCHD